jgi:hypothetical protein
MMQNLFFPHAWKVKLHKSQPPNNEGIVQVVAVDIMKDTTLLDCPF